jgi:hypothetical protein
VILVLRSSTSPQAWPFSFRNCTSIFSRIRKRRQLGKHVQVAGDMRGYELDSCGSRYESVSGSCARGNKKQYSITKGEFFVQLRKESAYWCRLFIKYVNKKGKAVPLQAWSGPESSRKLRFPDFMTAAQDGGRVVSLMHRPPLPPGNIPGTHFC